MGLLLFVDYLLVAILIFLPLSALGLVALVAFTVPILAYTIAEAAHAFRPTQESITRADLLALVSFGTTLAITAIVTVVGLVTGQLG